MLSEDRTFMLPKTPIQAHPGMDQGELKIAYLRERVFLKEHFSHFWRNILGSSKAATQDDKRYIKQLLEALEQKYTKLGLKKI